MVSAVQQALHISWKKGDHSLRGRNEEVARRVQAGEMEMVAAGLVLAFDEGPIPTLADPAQCSGGGGKERGREICVDVGWDSDVYGFFEACTLDALQTTLVQEVVVLGEKEVALVAPAQRATPRIQLRNDLGRSGGVEGRSEGEGEECGGIEEKAANAHEVY